MRIGIVVPTYRRPDGMTPFFLRRALDSIYAQTYRDFKIYLIGDKYDNDEEFWEIANSYDKDFIYAENRKIAVEREKYAPGSLELWRTGGVDASNYGIDLILKDGIEWCCHLDHDDYWEPNHLMVFSEYSLKYTKVYFFYTRSFFLGMPFPVDYSRTFANNRPPLGKQLIRSSACFNVRRIPLRYRDTNETIKQSLCADADLWDRVNEFLMVNKMQSLYIPKITCHHPEEGNVIRMKYEEES